MADDAAVFLVDTGQETGYVDDVIRPSETRPRLIRSLRVLAEKRDTNPRKKHGNIPL